jgi:hypothetical protein
MIKRFGAKNFYSIKDGIEINFELKRVPKHISEGRNFATTMGIKGANGSGKTNIIKALSFLRSFCSNSAQYSNEQKLLIQSYFNNDNPIEFYCEFSVDGFDFYYELDLQNNCVVNEKLDLIKPNKYNIFTRKYDDIAISKDEYVELTNIKIKSNASIISEYDTFKFNSPMNELNKARKFFIQILTNVSYNGYVDLNTDYRSISKDLNDSPSMFNFVKSIIMASDSGIKDITIESTSDENGEIFYFPLFHYLIDNITKGLSFNSQSSGTKALFTKLSHYHLVLRSGGVLALDEFDIHMHSMILPKLINLFNSEELNKLNSQFIFTSHNTEIIDTLGKYRTILVNKDDNETYSYRLDEVPGTIIRNDRKISPLYLDGKIGGVPDINEKIFCKSIDNKEWD